MANLITRKRTGNTAKGTQDRADYQWLVSRGTDRHAGEPSGDRPGIREVPDWFALVFSAACRPPARRVRETIG